MRLRCKICHAPRTFLGWDGIFTASTPCPNCLDRAGENNYACEPVPSEHQIQLHNPAEGFVQIQNDGWKVKVSPDGSFEVNGEKVNASDEEKGRKLYEAFCKMFKLD